MESKREIRTVRQEVSIEVEVYITQDGQKFENKQKAERHERRLQIPKHSLFWFHDKEYAAYYLSAPQDLLDLGFKDAAEKPDQYGVLFPGWYLLHKEYNPFSWDRPTEIVYELDHVRKVLQYTAEHLPKEKPPIK